MSLTLLSLNYAFTLKPQAEAPPIDKEETLRNTDWLEADRTRKAEVRIRIVCWKIITLKNEFKHGSLILTFVITVISLRNLEPEYKITKREELPRAECVSLVCSRLLGVGIVAGASLVKVPQILNIVFARSGAGVSVFSQLLELLCYTAAVAYMLGANHFFCLCRLSSLYGFCCYHVYNGSVWENVLDSVQMMTIVIMFIARATQAFDNYIHKSTGQLSAVTYILLFLGSLARIFTSIKETGDNMIIAQYMMSTLMNLFICLQIQLYWGNKRSLKTE
ncbi:mannose-P-dolichol utilization defect 1 protein [Trichinella spiralis]|uniref:Mannose-P-dolichol utilization defect 1-like protein n=1 Tax=Trichinella spiralis TaxID=6334 RepID=E5SHJ7_TRISP|nr:mannose-P-dolichol utilization defect 1 protein [Trichinella spiralis]KRY38905.1 Mannose-P-dolichol utilization defect 1 -like protein [Trichinella spiralis]